MTLRSARDKGFGIVVSAASVPRFEGGLNEDFVSVVGNCSWVIDGAADPLPSSGECGHDASWYVRYLSGALAATLANANDAPLQIVLRQAIEITASQHDSACNVAQPLQPSASIALVRLGVDALEYLVLGDCTLLLARRHEGVTAITDKRLKTVGQETRRVILNRLIQGHGYSDEARGPLLSELARVERQARNHEGGYWIASYESEAAFQALVGTEPLHIKGEEMIACVLMTDGLERCLSTFHLYSSSQQLVNELARHGLRSCVEKLRAAERSDPAGRAYPRTKTSDDASGVLIQFLSIRGGSRNV